jgi:predicted GNAT superfamily acetyltransferase
LTLLDANEFRFIFAPPVKMRAYDSLNAPFSAGYDVVALAFREDGSYDAYVITWEGMVRASKLAEKLGIERMVLRTT